ncbi:MAG TPA: thymidylate kinase [Verrucomicrobiae bacterium]|jgi:dTMP kinase|nr:thymidylate kinase [Verrucomicrobiae bacterium]
MKPKIKTALKRSRPIAPKSKPRRFYGQGLPGVDLSKLAGKLIVVEGADGSGRSTQIARIVSWLEECGHATVQVGLKRSTLVSEELEQAQDGNILSHTTLSLFYATDFADQLENIILPGLRAGLMVLADRYIYTLMVRDMVRGMDPNWVRNLYGIALVPDAVFYLNVPSEALVERTFAKKQSLDYWESGMDLGLSRDMFDSFLRYQNLVAERFKELQACYDFTIVDGRRSVDAITRELRQRIQSVLEGK